MKKSLPAEQIRQYHEDGCMYPITIMGKDDAASHLHRLEIAEASHDSLHYKTKPYLCFTSAAEIGRNPLLLDAVESILGPDILLWDGAYVVKEPQNTNYVSWHQDLTYWGLESDSEDDILTAWVAIASATRDNGCMRMVKGSHTLGKFKHIDTYAKDNILHRGQSIDERFDENQVLHLELEAGQVSLHHGWVVHASNPNQSNARRVGLTLNYVKPCARQVVGTEETAILVRGEDRYNYFKHESFCDTDFAPDAVAYRNHIEQLKHAVYDNA